MTAVHKGYLLFFFQMTLPGTMRNVPTAGLITNPTTMEHPPFTLLSFYYITDKTGCKEVFSFLRLQAGKSITMHNIYKI